MELYYLCIDFVVQFIVEIYRNKLNQIKSNQIGPVQRASFQFGLFFSLREILTPPPPPHNHMYTYIVASV